MAANGGGPPFIKKEEEFDSKPMLLDNHVEKNDNKGISIAERRAAKCGFNVSNINAAQFKTTGLSLPARSPYFTVPPGISPSALLDSPVMLPNAQAQLSPTTGTFQFPSSNHESLKLKLKLASNGDNTIAMESSSAEALGVPLSEPSNFRAENKPFEEFEYPRDLQEMSNKDCLQDTLAKTEVLGGSKSRDVECLSLQPSNARNQMFSQNDQSGKERSTHPNNQEKHQRGAYIPKEVTKYSEDGFYWRKYGQKHVKGSEYPRSYYKCTNTNCPVTKKVERSHDGQIAEIVYKGSHNHPKPQPFKRFNEMPEINEVSGSCFKTEAGTSTGKDVAFNSDWRPHDILDGTSSTPFLSDFPDPLSRSMSTFQPVDHQTQEFPLTFGSQEVDDRNEASPESVSFNEEDDENGECEPKKRKRESFPSETTVPRSTREPKVVVQIESDIDILDDGYRWRKYGQKVVKGNPNPRSYYKCTTPGCPVRKHVERAANDIKSVITTYEGKHNHEVPSSKTGSLVISDVANLPPALTNSTVSTPSTIAAQKPDVLKAGKVIQDLPLYLERKPILNYNELMRSNLPGNFFGDLNFGASSIYPLSFPPFHSLPYSSLLMNSNPMKTSYPSSKLYPMIPDYLSLPSQINPVPGSGNVPQQLGGNFHYNNYAPIQPSTQGQEITKMVKPKEEQRDEDELYDTCLSIPNHGNGTI